MPNYQVQHMGVGSFAYGDVVDLDRLGLGDDATGKRHLDRLIGLGALAETDAEVHIAGDNPGDPNLSRGYPNGGRFQPTDEEIQQAKTLNPATGLPQDTPVEEARKSARKQAAADAAQQTNSTDAAA